MGAFDELVDGVEMDVTGREYDTFDDLVGYCRCVAGAVGRLCLGVFGSRPDPRAAELRRRARHRAAADEHPARHPRGPDQRPGLPAAGGPRPVRRARWSSTSTARWPTRTAAWPPLIEFAGRAGPRRGTTRAAAAAAARPAQRRLHRRDVRHLPAAARPDRGRPDRRLRPAAVAVRAGRRRPSRPARWRVRRDARRRSAGDRRDVVVVGGGLAGITAALRCADAGHRVTLLEARPRLGGLTYSFRRGDLDVDNGQHVFLRCCTAYRALLDRLGVADQVHAAGPARHPGAFARDGRSARLRRNGLPAPLHLGRLAAAATGCSARPSGCGSSAPRWRCAGSTATDPAVDRRSFGDWLREHGQDAPTVDALWDLVGVATLNAPRGRGLAGAGRDGVPGRPAHRRRRGRHRLVAGAAAAAARRRGRGARWRGPASTVRTGTPGRRASSRGDGGWSVRRDGRRVRGRRRGPGRARRRPPNALVPAGALAAAAGWSPRSAPRRSSTCTSCSTGRCSTSRSSPASARRSSGSSTAPRQSGLAGPGQYLAVSLSAADAYIDLPVADTARAAPAELRGAAAGDARRHSPRLLRHPRARRDVPARAGQRRAAPGAVTAAPGLFLAGAWTDTGWPATMEGAVRSGDAAADAVLDPARTTGRGAHDRRPISVLDRSRAHARRRRCGPRWRGSTRPAACRRRTTSAGATPTARRPTAAAARRCARRWRCCPPRRSARRPRSALPGAVAVELVHNFSLLHDDLIDGDVERRHRRTVWAIWGAATAILTGDALLALAHEIAAGGGQPGAAPGRPAARRDDPRADPGPGAGPRVRDAARRHARRVPGHGRRQDRLAAGRERRDRCRAGRAPDEPRSAALSDVRRPVRASPSSWSTTCSASGATRRSPASRSTPTCARARSRCRSPGRWRTTGTARRCRTCLAGAGDAGRDVRWAGSPTCSTRAGARDVGAGRGGPADGPRPSSRCPRVDLHAGRPART